MRITSMMMGQQLLQNLQSAENKMNDLQNQLSTGYKINKPSDDPVGIQNAMHIKSNIAAVSQWSSNASEALQLMNTTDSTLGNMTSMLQKIRELAVEGANGTMTTSDSSALADEVDQLSQQIGMLANTQVGSKYIFSGTATETEPLPAGSTTWQGNSANISFEVGNNLNIPVSVNGQALFNLKTTNAGGMLDTLSKLSSALRSGASTTVSNLLGDLETNINNVTNQRADLGARTNRMTAIQSQLSSTSLSLQTNLSSIQDADMAQTITEFTSSQSVYQAALQVGAKIIQPSLVDFMK